MSESAAGMAAAVLYALGVVVLFGVRSWQQRRATGSTGFNGFAADPGPAARLAGVTLAAAVLAGLVSPALVLLDLLPVLNLGQAFAWIGLVLALAGFGVAALAQQTMGRSWRIGVDPNERTDLVTHGIFGHVRNPIFATMIAAQAGTTLLAPTWLAFAGLVLLVAGVQLQVRWVEEPYLLATHGSAYAAYAGQAGRFLPGLGTRPDRVKPSWTGTSGVDLRWTVGASVRYSAASHRPTLQYQDPTCRLKA